MAVGLVMVELNVDEDEAFRALVRASQNCNRRLADIAEDVIYRRRLG